MKELLFTLFMFFTASDQFVSNYTVEDVEWMSMNIYFEARNQSTAGKLGVALVTMNRMHDSRYPDTVYEVVTQGPTYVSWKTGQPVPIKYRCQFTWYCDGMPDDITDTASYEDIRKLVIAFFETYDTIIDITEGATHYHANHIIPDWVASKTLTAVLDNQSFYRWEK